tara:strand:- start:1505 stop:1786 length:282 start_codon:yes stop_codon:yes gene_type:complete
MSVSRNDDPPEEDGYADPHGWCELCMGNAMALNKSALLIFDPHGDNLEFHKYKNQEVQWIIGGALWFIGGIIEDMTNLKAQDMKEKNDERLRR